MSVAENPDTPQATGPQSGRIVRLGWLWQDLMTRRRATLVVALVTLASPFVGLLLPLRVRSRTEDILTALPLEDLAGELGVILAIAFASLLMTTLRRFLMARLCLGIVTDLRDRLYRHILTLAPRALRRGEDGQVTNAFTYDLELLHNAMKRLLGTLCPALFLATVYGAALFWFSWQLATVLIAVFVPMIVMTNLFVRRIHTRAHGAQARQGELLGELSETLAGPKEIKLFRLEAKLADRFGTVNAAAYRETLRRDFLSELHPLLLSGLIALAIAGVIFLAAMFVARDWIAPGDLAGFLVCLGLLYPQVQEIGAALGQAVQIFAARERIDKVLAMPPEVDGARASGTLPENGRIEITGVSFTHDGGTRAIHDLTLTIEDAERVAIVGPSGAGKSTVLELLPRFNEPDTGTIHIGGVAIDQIALADLRTQVGLVLQVPFLFRGTLRENLTAGLLNVPDAKVIEAARQARVDEFADRMPQGYETEIDPGGSNLSVGQRQRIAIARVLLRDPPILLLDEPTSALDVASETHVGAAIQAAAKGRTTIIVAHRLSTVRDVDRIIVMDQGRVAEEGSHDALIAKGGLYAGLYAQFEGSDRAAKTAAV
ncbi:MAG: ABC transporter ATP-binding protein [Pseudomonadota bacterium]